VGVVSLILPKCPDQESQNIIRICRVGRLQTLCEGVIEWNSYDGTNGEIAWSPEPHEGSEFINSNAAEVLRNTTCGRKVSQIFPALCRREILGSEKLTSEVSEGAGQLQDIQISGAPLTTFRGVSDAQVTDARQKRRQY